jgi:type IV secretory pathway VirB2 component (pilin)
MDPEKPRIPQPISIGGGWSLLYAIAAVALIGAGVWLGRERGWSDPAVVVALLGGVWFVVRALMTRKKTP